MNICFGAKSCIDKVTDLTLDMHIENVKPSFGQPLMVNTEVYIFLLHLFKGFLYSMCFRTMLDVE